MLLCTWLTLSKHIEKVRPHTTTTTHTHTHTHTYTHAFTESDLAPSLYERWLLMCPLAGLIGKVSQPKGCIEMQRGEKMCQKKKDPEEPRWVKQERKRGGTKERGKRVRVLFPPLENFSRPETPSWVPLARRASFAWEPISCE